MATQAQGAANGPRSLSFARGRLDLDRPRVMAIVNMTPDSFSDGGRFVLDGAAPATSVALRQCARWIQMGADLLDIGGESTRPGAEPVGHELERERVVPLIRALRAHEGTSNCVLSVDTRHAAVAAAALEAGADLVNDVSGLADPEMAAVVARFSAGLVIGHMRGTPNTMQRSISFADLFAEVSGELGASLEQARGAGVAHDAIVVDPCVGFGKTAQQSAALVASAQRLDCDTGCPVLIGASRKSFLSTFGDQASARASAGDLDEKRERELASVVAALSAVQHGAAIVRVHDVESTVQALKIQGGIEAAYQLHTGGAA